MSRRTFKKDSIIAKKLKKLEEKRRNNKTLVAMCFRACAEANRNHNTEEKEKVLAFMDEHMDEILCEIFNIPGVKKMINDELRKMNAEIRLV